MFFQKVLSFFDIESGHISFSDYDLELLGAAQGAAQGVLGWSLRVPCDLQVACRSACALDRDNLFLFHHVIETGLAMKLVSIFRHEESDRAAETAFVIHKLVAMDCAISISVAQFNLSARGTEEVFGCIEFACGS